MPTGGPSGIAVSLGSPPGALTVVVCTATGAATPVAPAPTTTTAPTPNQILRLVFIAQPARTAASAFARDTYNLRPKASSNVAVLKDSNKRRPCPEPEVRTHRAAKAVANFGIGTLVPRTRSSRILCREFDRELRVQRGTRITELLVVLDSEVRKRGCRTNDANFGIGPLVRLRGFDADRDRQCA